MAVDVIALAGFQPADAASLRALKPDLINAQQAAIDAFYRPLVERLAA